MRSTTHAGQQFQSSARRVLAVDEKVDYQSQFDVLLERKYRQEVALTAAKPAVNNSAIEPAPRFHPTRCGPGENDYGQHNSGNQQRPGTVSTVAPNWAW